MSRFDDMLAEDLGRLIEDGSDLGCDAEFFAAESDAGIPIRIIFGDSTDGLQAAIAGVTDSRTCPATIRRSAVRDEIDRDPQPGDEIRISSGAMSGTWTITQAVPDQGDGVNLALRYDRTYVAGRTAQ